MARTTQRLLAECVKGGGGFGTRSVHLVMPNSLFHIVYNTVNERSIKNKLISF